MAGARRTSSHVRAVSRPSSIPQAYAATDGPLMLDPSSTVFHYAQELFEGLKAYRDANGKITLFRPDMNMRRMNTTAKRIALPVRLASAA